MVLAEAGQKMATLSVPDMSCGHCKARVEAALSGVPGTSEVHVDLVAHRVTVTGNAPLAALVAALDAAGYPSAPAD
jgi:copper chaperone